jgi:hypothetical protein
MLLRLFDRTLSHVQIGGCIPSSIYSKFRTSPKSLAHNEHVAAIDAPTWNALIDLLDLAKRVVGILGWAYFSTAYTIDGEYLMSEDAQRASYALDRLLNILYVPAAT